MAVRRKCIAGAVGLWSLAIVAPNQVAAQPVVSNVRAHQLSDGTRRVEVLYDLDGATEQGATVSVAFSIDGGSTYAITPVPGALSGDVGAGIPNGHDRRVLWFASATLPTGLRFEDVRAAVSASETPGGNPVLENGVPAQALAAPIGSWTYFKITVPAWQVILEVRTSGGSGDSDLYLRKGQLPGGGSYAGASTGFGNDAFVQIWYPDAGDWYVGLRGDAAYSGVSLLATFTDTVPALTNGQTVGNLADTTDHWQFYKITVPAWQVMLEVRTSGGNGDSDLYLRKGQLPGSVSYAGASTGAGNDAFVQIWYPDAGDWYVGLRGDETYSGVSLIATFADTVPALANGQTVGGLADTRDHWRFFKITVPAWQAMLEVRTSGGNGDSNLYLRKGQLPGSVSYTTASTGAGNDAFVQIWYPDAGDWYVGLRGDEAYSGVSLIATFADTRDHWQFFKITVPAWQAMLEVRTSAGNGDSDLYLRKGQLPGSISYTIASTGAGNDASVQIWYPDAGDWYVGLRGDEAYSGVSLLATFTDTVPALTNGQTVGNLSDTTDHWQFFKITVPVGQGLLEVSTSGGTGNCDLYLKKAALPSGLSYHHSSTGPTNNALIQVVNPDTGEWFVGLRSASDYQGVSLTTGWH